MKFSKIKITIKKITENTVNALRLGVEKDAHSESVRILSG